MTNTDESEFAQRHPKDGQKFTDLIQIARPDWTVDVFAVKDGEFPRDVSHFDGVMITGSPSSARSDFGWIAQLLDLIRQMDDNRIPMFGACFGHQAIARALGGQLGRNPGGWVHGLTRSRVDFRPDWAAELPTDLKLYGSHIEHVTKLPDQARATMVGSNGHIAGFVIGDHIYTTQHHPEMTHDFISALTNEMAADLGDDLYAKAQASLSERSDMAAFAESIARFFEHSRG
ncbi:MAG: type 1 glutamine amidotransferase [Pseudomonadota bacterium]